jgi:hypothetical protein
LQEQKKKLKPEEQTLYASLCPNDRKQLQQGLGSDVIYSLREYERVFRWNDEDRLNSR